VAGVLTGTDRESHPSGRRRAAAAVPRLQLLGEFAVTSQNGARIRIPYASQRVLALAALQRRPLLRRLAAARIWPHLPPSSALGSLRTALSRLHTAHPGLLTITSDVIVLDPRVQVDVVGHEDQALHLIRGSTPGAPCELPTVERQRVQELFLHALEASALRLAEEGQFALALHAAYSVLGVDLLRESAASTVISIHLQEGNRAQAVREFLDFQKRLRAALDVEPSAELCELVGGIVRVRGTPSLRRSP